MTSKWILSDIFNFLYFRYFMNASFLLVGFSCFRPIDIGGQGLWVRIRAILLFLSLFYTMTSDGIWTCIWLTQLTSKRVFLLVSIRKLFFVTYFNKLWQLLSHFIGIQSIAFGLELYNIHILFKLYQTLSTGIFV